MIIANPLYDVVFKYLMEDIDIAREILETILGEKILFLEVKPQETVTEVADDGKLHILRFDFKATIQSPTGELKKVLIELQKLKKSFNIMRFRRYLGDNYSKEDDIILGDGTQVKMPLPIVTIYILGFTLDKLTNAVVKVNRDYIDVLTGKKIENIKEEFIELLTHDSFVIQVRALPEETKTKLERVLQIFNPKYKTKDKHKLDFTGKIDDPLVEKMVNRLQRAIVDDEMRHKMDVEDEIEQILERENSKSAAEIAAQKVIIKEMGQTIALKDQAIEAERQKAEAERQTIVNNLILNTDMSDTQIASLTTFTLDFVQKCREGLK
jgi:hypothetical protein